MRRLLRLLILSIMNSVPARRLLRLLLAADEWLYYFQGQAAVRYGNGIHPKHRLMAYHDFFVDKVAHRSQASVVGIDLNEDSIVQARQRFAHVRVSYQVGDALVDLSGQTFDVVILSNVLEHLSGRPAFLRRVQASVHPSRILIRVPLFERDWCVPLKKELGIEYRLDRTHETEYTIAAFVDEMEEAGLLINQFQVRWGDIWAVCSPAKQTHS